jgi:MEMO1 family protein
MRVIPSCRAGALYRVEPGGRAVTQSVTPKGVEPSLERPKLRSLNARRIEHQGQSVVVLQDPAGVVPQPVLIPFDGYVQVVRHFDGQSTLMEIQARVLRDTGHFVAIKELEDLVRRFDEAMIIEGPAFAMFHQQYRQARRRPAAMAGRSYAATLRALRAQLDQLFVGSSGAGAPAIDGAVPGSGFRGVLSPHIDFQRGGPVYTWSYRELVERSGADTFVILGVAHQYCRRRFALTYKDFETPLGDVPTDRAYVDGVAAMAGRDLFDDELTHRTEHSIEFQVVFLQYLLGGRRDFTIVPILVGSFHDLMERSIDPIQDPEVRRFIEALRIVEAGRGRSVAYIGGIDLCHVGPEFGDSSPVDPVLQEQVRRFDGEMLDRAAVGDAAGWFRTAGAIGNRWRVCGLAATYTFLHAIGPARGRLLKYEQALDDRRNCCVSFASMAFHASEAAPVMPAFDAHVQIATAGY